ASTGSFDRQRLYTTKPLLCSRNQNNSGALAAHKLDHSTLENLSSLLERAMAAALDHTQCCVGNSASRLAQENFWEKSILATSNHQSVSLDARQQFSSVVSQARLHRDNEIGRVGRFAQHHRDH